jgi:nitroreductase
LKVLWAAYGYLPSGSRSIPNIGGNYSLIIYVVNATGSYRYVPRDHTLLLHDENVTKKTISYNAQTWPTTASAVFIVVWNKTRMSNSYFASAEAGFLVQNVYLEANVLNLGTCCVGGIRSKGLRQDLGLGLELTPLLVMPLGYPAQPYPTTSPNYDVMNENLPPVLYSNVSVDESINNIKTVENWSSENLSFQELSQILWAAYGSSNNSHRTTPSANGIYALSIYILNLTGVYKYVPEIEPWTYSHRIEKVMEQDKRYEVIKVGSNETWAEKAPSIILISFNSTFNDGYTGDGSASDSGIEHEWMMINAGLVIQNIFLEASAWNLGTNIISENLNDWNGTGAAEIRNLLSLPSSSIPLHLMPIGHLDQEQYNLSIRVWDWEQKEVISGSLVFKDSEKKISNANGWVNWTGVSGVVTIKVKYYGYWVSDVIAIYMNETKTIDLKCNVFDLTMICLGNSDGTFLQNANVTIFKSTSLVDNKIKTGKTDEKGEVKLLKIPNGTITITVYDGDNQVIANITKTLITQGQRENIICQENSVLVNLEGRIKEIQILNFFVFPETLIFTIGILVFIRFHLKLIHYDLKSKSSF